MALVFVKEPYTSLKSNLRGITSTAIPAWDYLLRYCRAELSSRHSLVVYSQMCRR
jgi:hypothetical protein